MCLAFHHLKLSLDYLAMPFRQHNKVDFLERRKGRRGEVKEEEGKEEKGKRVEGMEAEKGRGRKGGKEM